MSDDGTMTAPSVVLGAGPLGLAVTDELRARGVAVRLATRSGKLPEPLPGVEAVACDAGDAAQVAAACAGASTVYMCAQPPYTEWPERFPPLMRAVTDGVARAGGVLVFGDNLYMYGPVPGPMTEDLPYRPTSAKARTRAAMAESLLAAHRAGTVRTVIGRASDFFGPRVLESALGERVFAHALAGKAADVIGDPDQPHTHTFIRDFATALVTLGTREDAWGRAWHVPSGPTLTMRQMVSLVYLAAGMAPKLRMAGAATLALMGLFVPPLREMKHVLYQFDRPFVMSHDAYLAAFGGEPTPHETAIRETLDWYRRRTG